MVRARARTPSATPGSWKPGEQGGGYQNARRAPNRDGAGRPGPRYGKPEGGGAARRKGVCPRTTGARAGP